MPADTCGEEAVLAVKHERSSRIGSTRTATGSVGPGAAPASPADRTGRTAYFYNAQFNPYGRTWGRLRGSRRLRLAKPVAFVHPVAHTG